MKAATCMAMLRLAAKACNTGVFLSRVPARGYDDGRGIRHRFFEPAACGSPLAVLLRGTSQKKDPDQYFKIVAFYRPE